MDIFEMLKLFYLIYSLTTLLFLRIECSLMANSLNDKGLHISDYCPKMEFCVEDAHIMCMYYNPNKLMGPRCSNPKNVSIAPDLANKLLDITNAVRRKIAMGTEKGKYGEYLPRGYGISRLKWDNELATFAQVLANQCVLRHDLCRATKRFPDPGQTAGLVRFSYPEWLPVSPTAHFNYPGLSHGKISYAITQILKSWYSQKSSVSPSMVKNYPDWTLAPNHQVGRLYLEMVTGAATHMGCGISAYSEYAHHENQSNEYYNSIQVICNYSARPRKGTPVYNTKPPKPGDGLTPKCGCPVNAKEGEGCLCLPEEPHAEQHLPTESNPTRMSVKKNIQCSVTDPSCEPTVGLLPIFTVDNVLSSAHQDKLSALDKRTITPKNSMEIFDAYENYDIDRNDKLIEIHGTIERHNDEKNPKPLRPSSSPKKPSVDIKNRYFDTNVVSYTQHLQPSRINMKHVPVNKKSSIFTRVEQFHLPTHRNHYDTHKVSMGDVKTNIPQQKDHTNLQNLDKSYINRQQGFELQIGSELKENLHRHGNINEHHTNKALIGTKQIHQILGNEESFKGSAEENVDIRNLNEETDNKLLRLLDNLEQEVKHTELHDSEKKIFDVKIRKIYGKVVGKPVELLTHIQTEDINYPKPGFTDKEIKDFLSQKPISGSLHSVIDENDDMIQEKINTDNYNNRVTKSIDNEKLLFDNIDSEVHQKRSHQTSYSRITPRNRRPLSRYYEIPGKDYIGNTFDKLHSDERYKVREYDRYNNNLEIKNRNTHFNERNAFRDHDFEMPNHRNSRLDDRLKNRNYYLNNDVAVDDPLSVERRRYYQEKLENLEKRLDNARGMIKRRNEQEISHLTRRMRPSANDLQMRPSRSKNQMDSFYLGERARFVHGF